MTVNTRKRFIVQLCAALAIIGLSACNRGPSTPDRSDLSLSDFEFLELGMSYEQVVDELGEADTDAGSGIHIKVYRLGDGAEVMLSFPSLDNLTGVFLYDPDSGHREIILGSGK